MKARLDCEVRLGDLHVRMMDSTMQITGEASIFPMGKHTSQPTKLTYGFIVEPEIQKAIEEALERHLGQILYDK